MTKGCFQDTKNILNDIVVNKFKTVDRTYTSKLFLSFKSRNLFLSQNEFSHFNLKNIIKKNTW